MLGSWVERIPALAEEYRSAKPFPLLVIDGFVDDETAEGLLAEFPNVDDMPHSNDYVFGDKRQWTKLAEAGPTCRRFHDFLLSDEYAQILQQLTGRKLFVDPTFHGGGFHQGGDGSYLDTHVDFNVHPRHNDWFRNLNMLLYLNKDWPPEYGGDLLVRTDPNNEPRVIAPLFNRGVIMLTSDYTYHGYRKMSLPPGVTRKSIASYAYELIPAGSLKVRTTSWSPENAGIGKRFLAKHWSRGAAAKEKVLGVIRSHR